MPFIENKCILIVGAGPVGLSLAVLLKQMEVPFRIVEKKTESLVYSRAIATHSRTLEIFNQLKIIDAVKTHGRVNTMGIDLYQDGKIFFSLKLPPGESSEPYTVSLIQSKTEEILCNRLIELGVEIEYGVEVKSFHKNGDQVESVEVTKSDGQTERIAIEFLVGCDGGHSNVRKQTGISFDGDVSNMRITCIDTVLETDIPKEKFGSIFIHNSRPVGLIWLSDTTARVVIPNMEDDGELTQEESLELLKKNIAPNKIKVNEVNWFNTFKVNERRAEYHFRGNVYLCGDAAHTHSPAGGQGMNTGIQDAYNLAWKLAYLHKGLGNPDILNQSFHQERSTVVEMVLKNSGNMTRTMTSPTSGFNKLLLKFLLPIVMSFDCYKYQASNSLAEVHIKYDENSLIRSTIPGLFHNSPVPGVGLRLPPYNLFGIALSSHQNIHHIVKGGYCFELFLHVPECYLDKLSFTRFRTIVEAVMNCPTLLKLKEKSTEKLPFYKTNLILATKMFQPDQWAHQVNDPSVTKMQGLLKSSRTYLDQSNEVGSYFQFPTHQPSLFIARPDAVVGLASSITLENCQDTIESYFKKFLVSNI